MPSERLHPIIEIERVRPADILDGFETLEGRSGQGICISPLGEGPDTLLDWALQEINSATQSASKEKTKQHCVNAVVNARRSLGCLVDWYLERDLATLCKNPPKGSEQKARFLVSRGVIDELTSRVLARAIQKRNDVEHRYISPTLSDAEDVVELIRRTVAALRIRSSPEHGPWVFGYFLHASGFGNKEHHAEFHGWDKPLAVFSRFLPQPWVGLVLPKNKTKAVIRMALLKETASEELVQLLQLAIQKFGAPSSFAGAQSCELLASEARLKDVS